MRAIDTALSRQLVDDRIGCSIESALSSLNELGYAGLSVPLDLGRFRIGLAAASGLDGVSLSRCIRSGGLKRGLTLKSCLFANLGSSLASLDDRVSRGLLGTQYLLELLHVRLTPLPMMGRMRL